MLLNVPGKGSVEIDIPENLTQEELDALAPEVNNYIASIPDAEQEQAQEPEQDPQEVQAAQNTQTDSGAPSVETWEDYQAKVNFDKADLEKKKELFDTWRGDTVRKVEATGALSTATGISSLNDQFSSVEKAYGLNKPDRNWMEKYVIDPSRLKDSAVYGYKTFELSEATEALEKATSEGNKEEALKSAEKVKRLNEEIAQLPAPQQTPGEIFLSKSILPNFQSAIMEQMTMLMPKLLTNSDAVIGQTAAGAGVGAGVGSLSGGVGALAGARTGASYGFRTGMATATGKSSYELEYSGQVLGLLSGDIQRDIRAKNEERAKNGQPLLKDPTPGFDGIDVNDPEQLAAAFSSPDIMELVKQAANEKGIPVGFVDGLTALVTFGAAGKFARMNKAAGLRGVGSATKAAQAGGLFGIEVAGGMGGEALSQYSAYGDVTDPNAVYMEGALEVGGGAPIVGAAIGSARTDLVQERLQNYAPKTALALAMRDFRNQSNLSERIMGQDKALDALPFNYDRQSLDALNVNATPEEQQQTFNRTRNMVGLALSEAHKILGLKPGTPININFSSSAPAFSFNPSNANTITINPELLKESLNTIDATNAQEKGGSKMGEKRRQAYIISALAEEIIHDVDLTQSRRDLYQQAVSRKEIDPNTTSFEAWRLEFGEKGAAEMTEKEKAETRRLYGQLPSGQELEGNALYSEFVRRLIQQKKLGVSTEETWRSRAGLKEQGSLLERSLLSAKDYWQKAIRGLPGNSSVVRDHLKAINGLLNEKQKTESTIAKATKATPTIAKTEPTETEEATLETGEATATPVTTPAQPKTAKQGTTPLATPKSTKQKPVAKKPVKTGSPAANLKRFQARGKYGSVRLVFPDQASADAYDAGRRRDGKDRKKDSATLAKFSKVSQESEAKNLVPKGKAPAAISGYRQFIRDSIVKAESGADVNIPSFEEYVRSRQKTKAPVVETASPAATQESAPAPAVTETPAPATTPASEATAPTPAQPTPQPLTKKFLEEGIKNVTGLDSMSRFFNEILEVLGRPPTKEEEAGLAAFIEGRIDVNGLPASLISEEQIPVSQPTDFSRLRQTVEKVTGEKVTPAPSTQNAGPKPEKVTANALAQNIERARQRLRELDAQEMDSSEERAPENIRKERVALRKYVGNLAEELAKRDANGTPREEAVDYTPPSFPARMQEDSKKINSVADPVLNLEEDEEGLGASAPRRDTPRGQEAARAQYFSSIDTTVANREVVNPRADKVLGELLADDEFVTETTKYLGKIISNNPIFKIEYEKMGIRSKDIPQEALIFLVTASRDPTFPVDGTRDEKKAAVFNTIKVKLNRLTDTEEMAEKLNRTQEERAQNDPEMEQEAQAEMAKKREAEDEAQKGVVDEEEIPENLPTISETERITSVDPNTGTVRTARTSDWGDTLGRVVPDTIENQDVPEYSETAFDENGQVVLSVDPDLMSRASAENLETIGKVIKNILVEAPFTSYDKQMFAEIWNGNADVQFNPDSGQVEITSIETERDRETGRSVPSGIRKKRQRSRERISKWMTETLRPRLMKEIGDLRFSGLSPTMIKKMGLSKYRLADLLGAGKVKQDKPAATETDKLALSLEKVLERLPDWEPFWLGPAGEIIPVDSAVIRMAGMNDMDSHAGEMITWLKDNQPEIFDELEQKYGYSVGKNINKEMMNRGWLRTTNDGNNILIEGKPGKEQVDLLTQKAISMELGLVHDKWPAKSKVLFKPGQAEVVSPMDLLGAAKVMTRLGITDFESPMVFKSGNALRMLDNRIANFTGGIIKGLTADKNNTVPWRSVATKLAKTVSKQELSWIMPALEPIVENGRLSIPKATDILDQLAKQKVSVTLLEDPKLFESEVPNLMARENSLGRLESFRQVRTSNRFVERMGLGIYHQLEDSEVYRFGKPILDLLAYDFVVVKRTPDDWETRAILEKNPFFMASFEPTQKELEDMEAKSPLLTVAKAMKASSKGKTIEKASEEDIYKVLELALSDSYGTSWFLINDARKFLEELTPEILDEANLSLSINQRISGLKNMFGAEYEKLLKLPVQSRDVVKLETIAFAEKLHDEISGVLEEIDSKVKPKEDPRASAKWRIVNPKPFEDMKGLREILVRAPQVTSWRGHYPYNDVIGFGRMYSTTNPTTGSYEGLEKGTFVFEIQTDADKNPNDGPESLRETIQAVTPEAIIKALREVSMAEARRDNYPEAEMEYRNRSNLAVATLDDRMYENMPAEDLTPQQIVDFIDNSTDDTAENPSTIKAGDIIERQEDEPPILVARKHRSNVDLGMYTMVGIEAINLRRYRDLMVKNPEGLTFMQLGITETMRAKKRMDEMGENAALVESHQALAIKNIIINALERGEDFVALTDAETAAMTEGHQTIKEGMRVYYGKGFQSYENGKIVRKNAGISHNILAKLTGDIGEAFNDGPSIEANTQAPESQRRSLPPADGRAPKRDVTGLKYSLDKFKDPQKMEELKNILGAAKVNAKPSAQFMKSVAGFNFPLRRMKDLQKYAFARKVESPQYWEKPNRSLRNVISDFSAFENNTEVLDFWNNLLDGYSERESMDKSIVRLLNKSPIDAEKKLAATASLFKVPMLKTISGESFITAPFAGWNTGMINKGNSIQFVSLSEIVPDEAFAAVNRLDAYQFASGKLPVVPKSGTPERVLFDENLQSLGKAETLSPEQLRDSASYLKTYIPSEDLAKYLVNEKKMSVKQAKDIVYENALHAARVLPIDESEMDLVNIGAVPFNAENPVSGMLTPKAALIEGVDVTDLAEMELFSDKELKKYSDNWVKMQVMEDGRVLATSKKEPSEDQLTALAKVMFYKKVPVFLNGKPLDYQQAIKRQAFADTYAKKVAQALVENDLVMDASGNIKSSVEITPDFRQKMYDLFKRLQDFSRASEAYQYTIEQVLDTIENADLGLSNAEEMKFTEDMTNLQMAFEGNQIPMLVAMLNDQVFPNIPESIKDYLVRSLPYFLPSTPSSEALNLVVQTKEFSDWFGKSQIKALDGSPSIMYYVATSEFRVPNTLSQTGGAKVYSVDQLQSPETQNDQERPYKGLATPVFVKAVSPFRIGADSPISLGLDTNTLIEKSIISQLSREIAKQTDKPVSEINTIIKNNLADLEEKSLPQLANPKGFTNTFLQGVLKKFGFDSIEIVSPETDGVTTRNYDSNSRVIVFDPNQLKLANGFNTEFSSASPDVLGAAKVTGFQYQLEDVFRSDISKVPFLPRVARELLGRYANKADKILGLRRFWQDRFIDLQKIQQSIEMQTGEVLPDSLNAYQLEELYHGKVGARLSDFTENVVEPILKMLRDSGIKLAEIEEFMYGLHAKERNERIRLINPMPDEPYVPGPDATPEERGRYEKAKKNKTYIETLHKKGSGITDDQADEIVAKYRMDERAEEFEKARLAIREMIDGSLRQKLQDGLITQPLYDALTERYKNYVPLKGVAGATAEEIQKSGQSTARGFNVRGEEVKPTMGRITRPENILAYAVNSGAAGIVRAEKNVLGNAIYELVQAYPDPDLWEIAEPETIRRLVTRKNPDTGEVTQYARNFIDPTWMNQDDIFATKIAGQTKFIRIKNKDLVRNLKNSGVNPDHWSGKVLGGLATFMRLLSLTRTGLSPEFIFTNPIRDLQTAAANLSAEQYQDLASRVVKSVVSLKPLRTSVAEEFNPGSQTDEWGESYRDFVKAGGKLIGWMTGDIETQIKDIKTNVDETPNKYMGYLKGVGDWIEKANGGVENGTRLAVFHHARQMGATDQQAAAIARNATVNFTKKGEAGPVFNSIYLFFNASLQGSARLIQSVATSPKVFKLVSGIAASSVAASLFNEALGGDDEDGESWWSKVPEFKKRTNLILMIPNSGGRYVSLPLPYGYNVFWHLGNISSDFALGKKSAGQTASRLVETTLESFNPIGGARNLLASVTPTLFQPVVDFYTNQDWAGRPIMPSDFPGDPSPTPPSEKYFSSVSSVSKGITDTINEFTGGNKVRAGLLSVSPEVLDYSASYLFGAVGSTILRLIDLPVKAINPNEEIGLNDLPLVRRFVGEQPNYADYERFNTIREAAYTAKEEQDLLMKSGNSKERTAAAKKYAPELAVYPEVRSATGKLQTLKRRIDALKEEGDDTGVDYSKEIKSLKDQKRKVIMQVSKAYKNALDKQKN